MNIGIWRNWQLRSKRSYTDQKRISIARKWMRSARRLFSQADELRKAAALMAPEITEPPKEEKRHEVG